MKTYDHNVKNIARDVHDFFYSTYNNIHICGPSFDAKAYQNSGLMIVSTHRSMADYYLLGMLLHDMGVNNLRFAAGDNLTRLPIIGPKFRGFGAFTIKRDSAFNRSFFKNLCDQVVTMIEDNDSIIVFPEGGRSYHGNMMDLKGGVLAAAIVAQARNPAKKIYMLPISFSYERLYELPYFHLLEKGKNLRRRSNPFLKRLLGDLYYFGADILAYIKLRCNYRLGRKQGDIFIDYEAPISVNDLVDLKAPLPDTLHDELFAYKNSIRALGDSLHRKLLALYRLLPMHIIAFCLKQRQSRLITELQHAVAAVVEQCTHQNRNIKSLQALTDMEIYTIGVRQLSFYNAVSVMNGEIRVLKSWIIDYYAAAIS